MFYLRIGDCQVSDSHSLSQLYVQIVFFCDLKDSLQLDHLRSNNQTEIIYSDALTSKGAGI